MWLKLLSLLAVCVWTLASAEAEMQLYHQQYHQLVQPKDTNRNNSLFGYTVAFQQLKNGIKRVLVGAPTADDVGRVYACPLNTAAADNDVSHDTICTRITIGVPINRVHKYIENQHWKTLNHTYDLWLGSTIIVRGGDFITCAPRWGKSVFDTKDGYYVFGKCVKMDSAGRRTPMATPSKEGCVICGGEETSMNGGFGWSAATPAAAAAGGKGLVLVGGPQICTTGVFARTHEVPHEHSKFTGSITFGYQYFPPTCHNHDTNSTITKPTINFGYAMVFGKFMSVQFGDVLAVSSLYGKHGHGEVVLLGTKVSTKARFRDARVGSMFGAALYTARVHSGTIDDEHDDLLVGAPLYSADLNSEEQGAVFLYYGGTNLKQAKLKYLEHVVILHGEGNKHRSYFGSAITNLGDADDDGNDEFAVGAPYEEEVGAVYVFSVWYEGRELRYARQRLSPGLKGFGSSIAVLTDIDHNGCNEMAVGAFDSTSVAVLHCQPVVTVEAETDIISLPLWKLAVTDTSFQFESCVNVHYRKGIQVTRELSVNTTLTDVGGGVTLKPDDQLYTVQLNSTGDNRTRICRNITVNTDPDRLTSRMKFTMNVTALGDCFIESYEKTCALLSQRSKLLIDKYVTTHRCTSGTCSPTLHLEILVDDVGADGGKLELGSKESVAIRLRVNNTGDGAYEWCMKVRVKGVMSSRLSDCDYDDNKHEYTCTIGKGLTSLLNGATAKKNLILYTGHLTSEDTSVQVSADVENFCNGTSDSKQRNINFFANPERISIKGISMEPKQVIDQVHLQRDSDRNTTIRHIYKVENEGPTKWGNISLQISTDVFSFLILDTPQAQDVSCDKTSIQKPGVIRCSFAKIAPYSFVQITIPLVIVHRNVEHGLDNPVNITTTATLEHKLFTTSDSRKVAKGSTAVSSIYNSVLEWWHILLACIAALLLLALIVFILYKYGFFKRQTKKNLQQLKRRSAMRQSQRMSRLAPPPLSAATANKDQHSTPTKEKNQ